jgi:DNA (cytosine-5)-methyltransferase 1
VFVVGYLGDWQRPAKVLFESESVCRDTPPSRKAGQEVAGTIAARFGNSRNNHEECVPTVAGSLDTECGGGKLTHQSITNGHVIGTITARMFNALGTRDVEEGALLPVGFGAQMSVPQVDVDLMQTLQAKNPMAVAQPIHYRKSRRAQSVNDHETWVEDAVSNTLNCFDVGDVRSTDVVAQPVAPALTASNDPSRSPQSSEVTQQVAAVHAAAMQVRRLTPVECERLQGFPDNYTNIPWRKKAESPDGPRYKALGNSMAVPVMRWIGERINKEDKL